MERNVYLNKSKKASKTNKKNTGDEAVHTSSAQVQPPPSPALSYKPKELSPEEEKEKREKRKAKKQARKKNR